MLPWQASGGAAGREKNVALRTVGEEVGVDVDKGGGIAGDLEGCLTGSR